MLRYEDFVDGDRCKRVYAALRPGSSALTCVLFFDSINRDTKGFDVLMLMYVLMYVLILVLKFIVMYVGMYVVMLVLLFVLMYLLLLVLA